MELKALEADFSICQVESVPADLLASEFCFVGKTDEELSLVCLTELVPSDAIRRDDGWKGFRIQGVLDFSLIGILAPITTLLARHRIGIFALSTYNTDYVLVKAEQFEAALQALREEGYQVL